MRATACDCARLIRESLYVSGLLLNKWPGPSRLRLRLRRDRDLRRTSLLRLTTFPGAGSRLASNQINNSPQCWPGKTLC